MDSGDKMVVGIIVSLMCLISIVGIVAILSNTMITETAMKHGYNEVQNIGTSGYHWVKISTSN